ncbi:7715_t:CDS:2, partial [Acaulospora colombiana]
MRMHQGDESKAMQNEVAGVDPLFCRLHPCWWGGSTLQFENRMGVVHLGSSQSLIGCGEDASIHDANTRWNRPSAWSLEWGEGTVVHPSTG